MDLMFSLTVRRIAGYRNELGDYYSNRTFCHISMGDNGNTEVDDFASVKCRNYFELLRNFELCPKKLRKECNLLEMSIG